MQVLPALLLFLVVGYSRVQGIRAFLNPSKAGRFCTSADESTVSGGSLAECDGEYPLPNPAINHQALFASISSVTSLPRDTTRIFHGRGGLHSGCEHITLDWLDPVWLVTSFVELSDGDLKGIEKALSDIWKDLSDEPFTWVYQCRQSGGATTTTVMAGEIPEPHLVKEDGLNYLVHVARGQNHGIFLDMANGRKWMRENASGKIVLNLFAYTCAFSVAALAGGATEVVNIDMA